MDFRIHFLLDVSLGGVLRSVLSGGDPAADPEHAGENTLERWHLLPCLGTPWHPPAGAGGSGQQEGILGFPAETATSMTGIRISRRRQGWHKNDSRHFYERVWLWNRIHTKHILLFCCFVIQWFKIKLDLIFVVRITIISYGPLGSPESWALENIPSFPPSRQPCLQAKQSCFIPWETAAVPVSPNHTHLKGRSLQKPQHPMGELSQIDPSTAVW